MKYSVLITRTHSQHSNLLIMRTERVKYRAFLKPPPEFDPFPPRHTPCTRVHADKKGHNFWCARLPPKKSVHFHFTHRMISQLRIFYFTYIPQCSPAARCAYSYIRVDSGCLSFKLQASLLVLLLAPSAHRECMRNKWRCLNLCINLRACATPL